MERIDKCDYDRGDQMKVGDLVGFKEDQYKEIGIVTSVTGCHYGYIEIVIGKWRGQIRSDRLKVIHASR